MTIMEDFQDVKNRPFMVKTHTEKYLMLDFWGTWCVPCVAGIPKLKAFQEKHKDKIELISVAYEKDVEKVKKFISEKQMDWTHKFELNDNSVNPTHLVSKLRIDCYPTFILLDKSGKILARGCGEQELEKIARMIE
jgi:thiol-disulfide isomerase/thioredoxin